MSTLSNTPQQAAGFKFYVPAFAKRKLAQHPLTCDLYPRAIGLHLSETEYFMSREDHADHLLMFCIEGAANLTVCDEHYRIRAGDLVLLPKGLQHQYSTDKNEPWSAYWIHFDGKQSENYIAHLNFPEYQPFCSIGYPPEINSLFQSMLEVRNKGYSQASLILAANQLKQLFTYLAVLTPQNKLLDGNDFHLESVHTLMKDHIYEKLDLDTLAASTNLSKYHFAKKYKQMTGNSPIQHFIHLKMEEACQLMDFSEKSISEIGEILGYGDSQYFSRLFKKVVGLSPRDYRKLKQG